MDEHTQALTGAGIVAPQRTVEFEWHRPHLKDLDLPKIDLEPARTVIEQIAITGIGLAIVAARSVTSTIEAAQRAGGEAADNPGPFTRALLGALGHSYPAAASATRHAVPVLPIADYAALDSDAVIARLTTLSRVQLESVRAFELEHERRTSILKAIDGLLATAS